MMIPYSEIIDLCCLFSEFTSLRLASNKRLYMKGESIIDNRTLSQGEKIQTSLGCITWLWKGMFNINYRWSNIGNQVEVSFSERANEETTLNGSQWKGKISSTRLKGLFVIKRSLEFFTLRYCRVIDYRLCCHL